MLVYYYLPNFRCVTQEMKLLDKKKKKLIGFFVKFKISRIGPIQSLFLNIISLSFNIMCNMFIYYYLPKFRLLNFKN